jgi:hypothetical protein
MRPDRAAGTRSLEMTRYLIKFDDGDMTFPEEETPEVSEDVHVIVRAAQESGAWIFGGGLHHQEIVSVVATDGTITDGPYPETKEHLGGFSIIEAPTKEEALEWAAKFAAACRCAQTVLEIMDDPEV